MKITKE